VTRRRRAAFGPLVVDYDDQVLAPRPWTLLQSERAADHLRSAADGIIVELHCGAGHIGQAAAALSGRPLVQVDDAAASCAWSAHNAARNQVPVAVVRADIASIPLRQGCSALVLADPPYVPSRQTSRFPDDPEHAIDGGDDGLDGFRTCLPEAARLLQPGGTLVLQVWGPEQADAVAALASDLESGLEPVATAVVSPTRAVVDLLRR
jgi:methylase of polypeptide subunit release factors